MDKGVFVCLPTAKAAKVHNWQRFLRLKTWLENKESFGELIISVEFDFLRPFTSPCPIPGQVESYFSLLWTRCMSDGGKARLKSEGREQKVRESESEREREWDKSLERYESIQELYGVDLLLPKIN